MKRLIIISVFSLFIFSCGENIIEEVVERYDDGKFKVVHFYKRVSDNQELIKKIIYFENGNIYSDREIKNGVLSGKSIYYYENGQVSREENYKQDGNFKEGQKDGKCIYYDESGNIHTQVIYEDNKRVWTDGIWYDYFYRGPEKKISTISIYKDNIPYGKWSYYRYVPYLYGQFVNIYYLVKEEIYNDGELLTIQNYEFIDHNGNVYHNDVEIPILKGKISSYNY